MEKYGPHRRVPYRREREGRTNYHYRRGLLRSGKPRLVARISLKHVRAQIVSAKEEGDEVLTSAFSKELSEWGWKGYTANTPSAYLVGLLCGFRALEEGLDEAVLDIDRFVASPEAKIFAVLKGALDSGLYIPHDEGVLPSDERCAGEHIANYGEMLEGEEYEEQFSKYLSKDLKPENFPEHFKEVKEAIKDQYGE